MTVACGRTNSPVKLLLEAGASVNQTNSVGQTALHMCCHSGQNTILKTLLSHSSDVHLRDAFGRTPLHYACKYNSLDIIDLLLEAGAQVNIVDSSGLTELELAAQSHTDPGLKVRSLIQSYSYPNRVIIEVYETLASSFLRQYPVENDCLDNAIKCMSKATLMRKEHNLSKIVSQPLECYGFTKEGETMEYLELHHKSREELEMQAMIARERIYKGRHTTKILWDNLAFQGMYIQLHAVFLYSGAIY